jgi:hypothetical protein
MLHVVLVGAFAGLMSSSALAQPPSLGCTMPGTGTSIECIVGEPKFVPIPSYPLTNAPVVVGTSTGTTWEAGGDRGTEGHSLTVTILRGSR